MFGMIEHMKALALAQSKLIKVIVAEQKRHLNDNSFPDYVATTEELERKMDDSLRKLGIIR